MPGLLRALVSAIRSIKPKLNESEPLHCKENLEQQKKSTRKFCQDLLQACSCACCRKNRYSAKKLKTGCCAKQSGRQSSAGMLAHCDDPHLHHNDRQRYHQHHHSDKRIKDHFCCCGNGSSHTKCSKHFVSSSGRQGAPGAKNKNTKDIFSKYDRQSFMTYRHDTPTSQFLHMAPDPVIMPPLVLKKWPQSSNNEANRESTESTCIKPPPNRAIISNDGFSITTLSREKYHISNEGEPYLTRLDQKSAPGHQNARHITEYTHKARSNCSIPAGGERLNSINNTHLPSFESVELFRADDTSLSSDRTSINGDFPPEYSEPPSYYSTT